MNLHAFLRNTQRLVVDNSPNILTGIGVAGTVTTAVLAAKGGFKASHRLSDEDPYLSNKEKAKLTWKFYIPAASSGVVTIAAVLGSNHVNAHRTAAAVTAYSLTETAFSEYRDQVVKTLGEKEERKLRGRVAEEKVKKTAPGDNTIVVGSGSVLCCELHTGRYFMSSMEALRRAVNDINDRINHDLYVNLDEFYDALDIPHTTTSNRQGWESSYGLLDVTYSSVLTPDGAPCLAFEYNYLKPI